MMKKSTKIMLVLAWLCIIPLAVLYGLPLGILIGVQGVVASAILYNVFEENETASSIDNQTSRRRESKNE